MAVSLIANRRRASKGREWPPWLFLLGVIFSVGLGLHHMGRFEPISVNDTSSYTDFPFDSLSSVLSRHRTLGYPLFLNVLSLAPTAESVIPLAHFVVYSLGTLVFYFGLRSLTGFAWEAAFCSAALLSANILHLYLQTIATDTIAAAFALMAIGWLFLYSAAAGGRMGIAALLSLAAATCWLIRPAYLFIVVLCPALGALMAYRNRHRGSAERPLRTFVVLSIATCAPLVAWCSLRWMVVRDLGTVSFGGYNLVGVAGQFLDQDLAAELPERHRPLARAALEQLNRLPAGTINMSEAPTLNYMRMELNYDVYIWMVMAPAAEITFGDDNVVVNAELGRFGAELIRRRPGSYFVWIAKSLRQAVQKLPADFAVNPFGFLIIVVSVPLAFLATVRAWRQGSRAEGHLPMSGETIRILFVTTIAYAALSVAQTIVVCPPLGRFTDAAALLLPALGTAVVLQLWRWLTAASQPEQLPNVSVTQGFALLLRGRGHLL